MTDTHTGPTSADAAPAYPFSLPHALDLDPHYAELRRDDPVSRVRLPYGEGTAWLVTRMSDARIVLGDSRFSTAAATDPATPRMFPTPPEPDGVLAQDPPDHTRLRRLVGKAFTARRVEEMRPRVRALVDSLLDDMVAHGSPADLVEFLAVPFPVAVICELLGVPLEDRDLFRTFSDAMLSSTRLTAAEIQQVQQDFMVYMDGLVAQRRDAPTEDLLGSLALATDNDDHLTKGEIVNMGVSLLIAGHETSVNQITNLVHLLLTERKRYESLVADPALVPAAVEEMLRYTPLVSAGSFVRVATEDVELSTVTVRAGEPCVVHFASANRDEEVFDHADELDFHRARNAHIAFGHGAHHCIGAQLGRLELQEALSALVRRFPTLDLAEPVAGLKWKQGMLIRGLERQIVSW
ncbi:cytochrome P450 [Streptomyces sp. NBRC 110028]|uniref:cytochrome P450 n=1 Tax=Streptomyces sp. NBRC 110028 TaxID=1621260 RepID=UPI0006E2C4A0|nr:cytochrome P450 [Streptomyces sp. NBRC 110028]